MNEALDLILEMCALVRRENQKGVGWWWWGGGGGDWNICHSHTVVKQVAEGDFNMWDSNYFDGNSRLATAAVNSQLWPLGRCCDGAFSLVQSLTIQNQKTEECFPDGGATNKGKDSKRPPEEGASKLRFNGCLECRAAIGWKWANNVCQNSS